MNDLLARLQAALARQRTFVADAGHELRTPLAVLSTELELADRPSRTREELVESIRQASLEAERLRHLTDELMFLARHDDGRAPHRGTEFPAVRRRGGGVVVTDPGRTTQRHPGTSGRRRHRRRRGGSGIVSPRTRQPAGERAAVRTGGFDGHGCRARANGPTVCIDVADEGPDSRRVPSGGIRTVPSRRRLARARADGGTGLGLAIVLTVAHDHGGDATAENRAVGRGGSPSGSRDPEVYGFTCRPHAPRRGRGACSGRPDRDTPLHKELTT